MPTKTTAPKTAKKPAAKATKTKTTTRKPATHKPAAKKTPAPTPTRPAGFIDEALMQKAIALRGEGKTMKEIGVELNVKATAYLAKKIKATYGADALSRKGA